MRVLDMRLIVFVTLILLTAAMPANCAEEPTGVGSALSSVDRQARHIAAAHLPIAAARRPTSTRGLLHVDHPGHAEAILQHPEPQRPECLADGHHHVAALGQRSVDAHGLGDVVQGERDADDVRKRSSDAPRPYLRATLRGPDNEGADVCAVDQFSTDAVSRRGA